MRGRHCSEEEYRESCRNYCEVETHVHEVVGSVRLAELEEDPHNHRFAGVTEEVVFVPGGHYHVLKTKTDFYENHFHEVCIRTGLQVVVGCGEDERHIHYIDDETQCSDGHRHEFIAATLIENPIGD